MTTQSQNGSQVKSPTFERTEAGVRITCGKKSDDYAVTLADDQTSATFLKSDGTAYHVSHDGCDCKGTSYHGPECRNGQGCKHMQALRWLTTDDSTPTIDIAAKLAAPFASHEIKFRPGMVKGNRCLALPYVDARVVQDRLDEVLGLDGWQAHHTMLGNGCVQCYLSIQIGGVWITKSDVGSPSEGEDATKGAYSDALKRAAVLFGVGRYLYRQPAQWVDYDPAKRWFARQPALAAPVQQAHSEWQVECFSKKSEKWLALRGHQHYASEADARQALADQQAQFPSSQFRVTAA